MTVPQQLPNFSTYVVPGVYWESTPTPVSALANVTNSVVALVGPGIGYETNTDTVTLSDLTITGVSSASAAIITTSAAHGFVTGQSVVVAGVNGAGPTDISDISEASPALVTADGHGLTTGQSVTIAGVVGDDSTLVNGTFDVIVVDADTFSIPVDTTGEAYSSGGTVTENMSVNGTWTITVISPTTFSVPDDTTAESYSSGGTASDYEALSQEGINTATIVVTSLDGSTVYALSTDYTISTTGSGPTSTNKIIRVSTGAITAGEQVRVSYQFTDSNYSLPQLCTSLAQVQALYGIGVDITTGTILSPISFAAQFAFDNGAPQVCCVATPTNDDGVVLESDLSTAYQLLKVIPSINLLVPLPVGLGAGTTTESPGSVIDVAQDLSLFVDQSQTEDDNLMVGIIGYETTVGVGPDAIAEATLDARVVEAWPNAMNWYNGYINATQVIGGYYLAAAYAGFLAGNYPQQGLTRQIIRDFSGIPSSVFQTMTKAYKDQLSAAGVAVAEISRGGVLWCRHGVTTDNTSLYNAEISLVRAQDYMVELLESAVEQSAIIGTPIGPDSIVNLQGMTIGVLNSLVTLGVIEAFGTVTATQLDSTPTEIQVVFQYQPSYPLNYVTFVFSVNTTTGNITSGTSTSSVSS